MKDIGIEQGRGEKILLRDRIIIEDQKKKRMSIQASGYALIHGLQVLILKG